MNTLILVDIQNDFCPGGALAVEEGDRVVAVANTAMDLFDLVVATQDWHPANHGSFAANHPGVEVGHLGELGGLPQVFWPVHCVGGTQGAEFHPSLRVEGIHRVFPKGTDPTIDSYSGFFDNGGTRSTGLGDFLESQGANRVYVMGLATDYCVRYTAEDAQSLGLETGLIVDGCRGVDLRPGDVDRALDSMRDLGIQMIESGNLETHLVR